MVEEEQEQEFFFHPDMRSTNRVTRMRALLTASGVYLDMLKERLPDDGRRLRLKEAGITEYDAKYSARLVGMISDEVAYYLMKGQVETADLLSWTQYWLMCVSENVFWAGWQGRESGNVLVETIHLHQKRMEQWLEKHPKSRIIKRAAPVV